MPRPYAFREALRRGFRRRCPNCGEGRLYSSWIRMHHDCPHCGLSFYRESGYYVGAMILNYGVTGSIVLASYLISLVLPPIWHTSSEVKLWAWFAFAIGLSFALLWHSRSLWLALDFWLDPWSPGPPWPPE
jgi:uncharacterized protein (DUF983 family)